MNADDLQRLARLEERVAHFADDMKEMKDDVKGIAATLSEAKGGWKTLLMMSGIAGAVGAAGMKLAVFMGVMK